MEYRDLLGAAYCPSVHFLGSQGPGPLHWSLVPSVSTLSVVPLKPHRWASRTPPGQEVYPLSPQTSTLASSYECQTSVEKFLKRGRKRTGLLCVTLTVHCTRSSFIMMISAQACVFTAPILHAGRIEAREAEAMPQVTEVTR